jgi:TPR repeat protein
LIFEKGDGVARDETKALKWYRKAAEQGHEDAQVRLNTMLEEGEDFLQDTIKKKGREQRPTTTEETLQPHQELLQGNAGEESSEIHFDETHYKQIKEQIVPEQAIDETERVSDDDRGGIAKLYLERDVQKEAERPAKIDETVAGRQDVPEPGADDNVRRCIRAAQQGDAEAQLKLGMMYKEGSGVAQDDAEALHWFLKSAEQGIADAQVNLGDMYQEGLGAARSDIEAVKWYRKAAKQGNAIAQYNLGLKYFFGEGVQQDFTEAVKWYTRAAQQGNVEAQFNLGGIYEEGIVVAKDRDEAERWYRRAAENGHERAKYRLDVMNRKV